MMLQPTMGWSFYSPTPAPTPAPPPGAALFARLTSLFDQPAGTSHTDTPETVFLTLANPIGQTLLWIWSTLASAAGVVQYRWRILALLTILQACGVNFGVRRAYVAVLKWMTRSLQGGGGMRKVDGRDAHAAGGDKDDDAKTHDDDSAMYHVPSEGNLAAMSVATALPGDLTLSPASSPGLGPTPATNANAANAAPPFDFADVLPFVREAANVLVTDTFTPCFDRTSVPRRWNFLHRAAGDHASACGGPGGVSAGPGELLPPHLARGAPPWRRALLAALYLVGAAVRYLVLFPLRLCAACAALAALFGGFLALAPLPDSALRRSLERGTLFVTAQFFVLSWSGVVAFHGARPERHGVARRDFLQE